MSRRGDQAAGALQSRFAGRFAPFSAPRVPASRSASTPSLALHGEMHVRIDQAAKQPPSAREIAGAVEPCSVRNPPVSPHLAVRQRHGLDAPRTRIWPVTCGAALAGIM